MEEAEGDGDPVARLPLRCGFMSKTHSFCFDLHRLGFVSQGKMREGEGGMGMGEGCEENKNNERNGRRGSERAALPSKLLA